MASKTAATRRKRKVRDKRRGRARKLMLQKKGTTLPAKVLFGDVESSSSNQSSLASG